MFYDFMYIEYDLTDFRPLHQSYVTSDDFVHIVIVIFPSLSPRDRLMSFDRLTKSEKK